MIEKWEDLGVTGEETPEQLNEIFKEKLGITFEDMTSLLSKYVEEKAEELASNFVTVIPYEDYSKFLEDPTKIADFFRREASKPENWTPSYMGTSKDKKKPNMIEVLFENKAVDDGKSMTGFIFLSYSGKVLHAFVHGDPWSPVHVTAASKRF